MYKNQKNTISSFILCKQLCRLKHLTFAVHVILIAESNISFGAGGIISKNHEETFRKFHGDSFRNSETNWWGIISKFGAL